MRRQYYVLILAFLLPTILSCSTQEERFPTALIDKHQQRQETITILGSPCAQHTIERAISETRKQFPEVGFNLYYNEKGIPNGEQCDFTISGCPDHQLRINNSSTQTHRAARYFEQAL